jgi:hypothetical protein
MSLRGTKGRGNLLIERLIYLLKLTDSKRKILKQV